MLLALVSSLNAAAQNCIDLAGSNPHIHTQNFDALGTSPAPQNGDASNVTQLSSSPRRYLGKFDNAVADSAAIVNIPGWALVEEGTSTSSVTGRYNVTDGSQTGGNTFSFGTNGDRSLGSLNDDTVSLTFVGGCFRNTGSTTLTSVIISFTGEMWRRGAAGAQTDRLDFQYAVDAADLFTGAYVDHDPFDFVTPSLSGTAGPRDGNQPTHRTVFPSALLNVTLPPGARLYVRWRDSNIAGADDGLAIDDFTIRFAPPSAAPVEIAGRVTDHVGRGVYRAAVTMWTADGHARIARTNSFGYYRFTGVPAGEPLILSVRAHGRTFDNASVLIPTDRSVADADFRSRPR